MSDFASVVALIMLCDTTIVVSTLRSIFSVGRDTYALQRGHAKLQYISINIFLSRAALFSHSTLHLMDGVISSDKNSPCEYSEDDKLWTNNGNAKDNICKYERLRQQNIAKNSIALQLCLLVLHEL